jgi:hypothetical protein
MLALVTALVLAAEPARVRFERVDVLSEDPGLWLSQEAPRLGVDRLTPTVRFLTQVKAVWSTPVRGLGFGVSVESQSLVYEYPLLERANLSLSMGMQTRLLLPRRHGQRRSLDAGAVLRTGQADGARVHRGKHARCARREDRGVSMAAGMVTPAWSRGGPSAYYFARSTFSSACSSTISPTLSTSY